MAGAFRRSWLGICFWRIVWQNGVDCDTQAGRQIPGTQELGFLHRRIIEHHIAALQSFDAVE